MGHLARCLAYEGITVILDDESRGLEFSGKFTNTPIDRILSAMAERCGGGGVVAQRDGYVYVGKPTEGDYDVAVFAVPSGDATDWIDVYSLAGSERVRANGIGDLIVVRDTAETITRVRRFHEAVSGCRREYHIELVMVELTDSQTRSLGIDMALSGDQLLQWDGQLDPLTGTFTSSLQATLSGILFGDSQATQGLNAEQVTLHLVEGDEATLEAGDEINVRQRVASPEGTVTDVDTQVFQTGLQIKVRAHSVDAGKARLDIEPELSSVREFVDGLPTIATRRIKSQVYLGNGGVAVLGGFHSSTTQSGGPRLPGTTIASGIDEREDDRRFFIFVRLRFEDEEEDEEIEDEADEDMADEDEADEDIDDEEDDEAADHDPADEDDADLDDDDWEDLED
ncbi:type II secretion system protein GspD [Mucisphaera calidilacus]|nr:hypothetical protein [Mucisphaera calidilacus]